MAWTVSLSSNGMAGTTAYVAVTQNLDLTQVQLLVVVTEAGLCVASEPSHGDAVTLDLELVQRSIDDQCPGKVLYEQGLYLVEQVRIQRNPLVWMWTDTWLREMVDILPPVAPQQLQTDQDALLQQFLHPMKAQ